MKRILIVLCLLSFALSNYAMPGSSSQSLQPQQKVMKAMPFLATTEKSMTVDEGSLTLMKLGPQKAFNTISDLYGTWMVNYSDGTQQYFTITIRAGLSSGQVVIGGWWIGSLATDITGTVSLAGG